MNKSATRRQLAIFMAERLAEAPKQRAEWIRRLAAFLVESKQADQVDLLINDIAHELLARQGHLSMELESARKLTPQARKAIGDSLRARTGADTVSIHESVTPELVGGFVARTPDADLDASVRHGLRKLAAIT